MKWVIPISFHFDIGQSSGTKKGRICRREVWHSQPMKMSCCVKLASPQAWTQFVEPSKKAQSIGKKNHVWYCEYKFYVEPHAIHTTSNEDSLQCRQATIQEFMNKFCDFYTQVMNR